jgi:hypothetical protein
MGNYFGFEYQETPDTKTGRPNPHTNRLSTAGNLVKFESMETRTAWLIANPGKRIAVKRNEARKLHCGLTDIEFADKILNLSRSQTT